MKIKDLILKTQKLNWQELKDLQPVNLKNNYHSDKVKESLIKNGFANTIYVWENKKGEVFIVDGHCRRDVLNELINDGYDIPNELNCTFLDLPNKKTAVKYLLQVFNQKTNPINEESLNIWLDDEFEIKLDDIEINVDDLHIELNEVEESEEQEETKEDEVPEVKHNFVVKGDLFELVDEEQGLTHRVLCGDSTMINDVEKVMNGEKADMVFTDPPYNVGYKGTMSHTSKNGKRVSHVAISAKYDEIKNDAKSKKDFQVFISDIISMIKLKCIGGWYISFSSQTLDQLLLPLRDAEMNWKSIIIWMKNQATISGKDYKSRYEPIVYGDFGKNFTGERYNEEDIWEIQRTLKNDLHPTMKPINLIAKAINNSSKQKDLVIDFFLGSGSTLIACQQTKRKCYGIELDEHYCGVVITRWVNYMEKEGKKYSIKRNGEQFTLENERY